MFCELKVQLELLIWIVEFADELTRPAEALEADELTLMLQLLMLKLLVRLEIIPPNTFYVCTLMLIMVEAIYALFTVVIIPSELLLFVKLTKNEEFNKLIVSITNTVKLLF